MSNDIKAGVCNGDWNEDDWWLLSDININDDWEGVMDKLAIYFDQTPNREIFCDGAAWEIREMRDKVLMAESTLISDFTVLSLALKTLEQIATTPRNSGAKLNAKSTLLFIAQYRQDLLPNEQESIV